VRAGWQGKPRLLAAITPNTLRINLNILTSRVFGEQNLKGVPMKLAVANGDRVFVVRAEEAVDVTSSISSIPHVSISDLMIGLAADFAKARPSIERAAASGKGVPLSSLHFEAPIPRPRNIVCMAVNYMEDGTRSAPAPINAFHKAPTSVIGHGGTMILPDAPASNFEAEAEIALIIGKRASNVSAANAMSHVFGYLNFIDGSARGLLPHDQRFFQVKSRDTFAPMGPFIVTADEVPDPQKLQIRLWVNGVIKQDFNTDDMAHKIPRCIEWASSIHTLEPGDVLATGTNHRGLSSLQNGDMVELECQGMGRLSFKVRDELKRTWSRETRLEREQKGLEPLTPQLSGKYSIPTP
jgi:2-keto-4-pentenoate hydratase/2-oxohepta-3-ene-1,7-dioic acid hydratase in catechol pathway